ncbi:MAG: class I SAM-dependent RNA methyltransferase, partial [Alphaproteobacteria bacterium]|nr:class I SAM-dependent RNA methyltransferase [Alphaproteobacteria bacterium]
RPRPESEPETLATIRPVTLAIASQVVAPPPGAFFQAVREAETRLTDIVTRALEGARRVVDLYAGCGTFSLALVGRGRLVAAFEGDEQAVAALAQAFKRQPFPATVTRRDLAKRPLGTADLDEVDAVVLDPPHAGARAQCRALARSSARTIAYVSCNPATLARDLEFLIAGGYRLEALTLVDQFLWSAQIEAVAILRRKGKVVL